MVVLGWLTVLKVVLCWVGWGPYILVDGSASRIQISCPQLKHARPGIYPTKLTNQYLMLIPHDNIPQAPPDLNMPVQYLIPIPHRSTWCKHTGPIIHPTKHNKIFLQYFLPIPCCIDPPYRNMLVQPLYQDLCLPHCLAIEKHAGPTFDTDPSIKLHHNQVLNIASQGAQSNVQSWV